MPWSYNPLWHLLIDRKIKKIDLMRKAGLNANALTHLGKDQTVTMDSLEKICKFLNCKIEDIVEYIPDEENDNKVEETE